MAYEPCPFEVQVLRWLNGEVEMQWGAAVGAALEFLAGSGYCKRNNHAITPKGRELLQKLKEEEDGRRSAR